jgi:hypothetical protein
LKLATKAIKNWDSMIKPTSNMVVDEYKSKFESGKMITISKHDERLENTLNVCGTWS